MQLLPMASSPDGLISAPVCGHHEDPRPGGAHHNPQRECHTRPRGRTLNTSPERSSGMQRYAAATATPR